MTLKFILTILLLLTTVPAWPTTYYVATTGSDSNNGTAVGTPFLTIQKGIDSVTAAGDIITVADGTYTVSGDTRYVGRVLTSRPDGSSGSPITLKSTNPLGADIVLPVHVNGNIGIEIARSYWVIEGFDIAGGGVNAGAGNTGIAVQSGAGTVIRKNLIHGIATGVCSNTTDGNTGVYVTGVATSTTIESNTIHTIGRLRNGESGCSTTISYNDHGVYVEGGTGTTIKHNVFYNDTRGWPVHVYKGGGSTTTNLNILNNTFANQSSPAAGHILLQTHTVTNANIKNNISSDVYLGMLQCNNVTAATNVSVSFNLTDHASSIKTLPCTANIVFASNTLNTSPGFVNAGTRDYTLASGSAAINAGTPISGMAYNGSNPDIGRYETFNRVSSTVNENFLDTTWGMNLNTPIQPASGATGVVALFSAVARTTLSSGRLTGTDSVMRTQFNGAVCGGGDTVTETYVPGTIMDAVGQKGFGYTAQAVTNGCGSAPPADPGTPHIYYKLNDNAGTNANDETANNLDGTLTNGPTWVTGKHSFGVHIAAASDDFIAVPYGNTVNPSTQSLTICDGVLPDSPTETQDAIHFGAPIGTNQRLYIGRTNATWGMGIQASSIATNTEFQVAAGWAYVCVVLNSATDQAQLYVNAVAGTSAQSVKSYTSFAIAGNFEIGDLPGIADSATPGATYDEPKVYTAALTAANIQTLYDAWEPPSPSSTCTLAQVANQFNLVRQTGGGLVENYRAQSVTVNVVGPGAVQLTTQTNATVAGCSAALRLRYNVNGGAVWLEVPDVMGPDGVAFYGSPADTDPDILKGTVDCCLVPGLTEIDGSTHVSASAVPVVAFTTNSSNVQRRVLRFDASAVGKTICFKEYTQQGQSFSSYTPSAGACVVVVPMAGGSGF